MDRFFTQTHCSRCFKDLNGGRIMSMFNDKCICIDCSDKEQKDKDYKEAVEEENKQIKQGNYNFKGIRG